MKKVSNRMFALAISLCMIFTMMPLSAHATETEHTHVWSDEWSGTHWFHWYNCTADGCDLSANIGEGKEGFGSHEIINDTHRPDGGGAHIGTCTICGKSDSWDYKYEYTWGNDETQHWFECGCGVKESFGNHSFDDDTDTTCDDCGYERTVGGGTTVNGIITLTPDNLVDGASGEGWSFDGTQLTIESGYTLIFEGECSVYVVNNGTISGGTFSSDVNNYGTISGITIELSNALIQGGESYGWSLGADNDLILNSGITFYWKAGETCGYRVENNGTITGGTFSDQVGNDGTISGGVFTGGMGNYSTVTGTVDLSTLKGFGDNSGQYGKQVTLPKAVIRGDLTYTGCDSSTPVTLEYYADGVKTAEWTVSGEKYSYPVEKYKRSNPDADLSGIEEITHEVKAVPMDGYEITIDNPIWDRFHVTVTHTAEWTGWVSNGDGTHRRTCSDETHTHTETAPCAGGTATCTEKAVCESCGTAYGNLAEHTYGTEWKSDGTNHWHECSCGAKADSAAHSGGTATCTEKAKCTVCGTVYGNLDSTKHAGGTEVKDAKDATCVKTGYSGDICCKGCGAVLTKGTITAINANHHTYGSWTVTKKATTEERGEKERICSGCGQVETAQIAKITNNPKTGDESDALLWAVAMGGGVLGFVILLAENRRRKFTK